MMVLKQEDDREEVRIVRMNYQPPYDWNQMMDFLRMRAVTGLEQVTDEGVYRRTLTTTLDKDILKGWIEVIPIIEQHEVELRIGGDLIKIVHEVKSLVRKALDLDIVPAKLPDGIPKGTRLPGCFNDFEMIVRAIIGQLISVKAATTILSRIVKRLGTEIHTPWEDINRGFPQSLKVTCLGNDAFQILGEIGVVNSKTDAILRLANALEEGKITFTEQVKELRSKLLKVKGIGPWTTEYLIMRGMSYPDAFPINDIVIKKAIIPYLLDEKGGKLMDRTDLSTYKYNKVYEKSAVHFANKYQPWRSYLAIAIWRGTMVYD